MTTISGNININSNFLSPVGFRFKLLRLPVFEHFVQKVRFPNLRMIMSQGQATPWVNVPIAGGALDWGEIVVDFKIDELMMNYTSILDWMTGIDSAVDSTSYANLESQPVGHGVEADATLVVLDSSMAPSVNFYFKDVFPKDLTINSEFDVTNKEIDYITATVTFAYTSYSYENQQTV